MPKFKKNTGFSLGFTPYTSPHSSSPFNYGMEDNSPYKYNQLKGIKHAMKSAKFEYKHKLRTGTRSTSARKGYRDQYRKTMSSLRQQYKEAKNAGTKKFTLNPFKAQGFGF